MALKFKHYIQINFKYIIFWADDVVRSETCAMYAYGWPLEVV